MEFTTSKEKLIEIVGSYQERSYSEDIDMLAEKGDNIFWLS